MKRSFSYPKTLKAIRQLPLEVSFDQVKYWVEEYQPFVEVDQENWYTKFRSWIFRFLDF